MDSEQNDPAQQGLPAAAPKGKIAALAAELSRLARIDPGGLSRRVAELSIREQAELALRLPARQRIDLVLHAPQPLRLVRALPDFEVYLATREVGPADAAPLLALASASQLLHLIDLEGWRGDRLDADRAGAWIALLLEAGEPALRRFLRAADEELLALLLLRWIGVAQLEYEDGAEQHGHGHGDEGTEAGRLTPDGYHQFSPSIPEHATAIRRLLQLFFLDQRERYERVMWMAQWQLPSELEEQALHWRGSRLEEHGFPPWDEALNIYAPPAASGAPPAVAPSDDPDSLAIPRAPLRLVALHARLVPAVDGLDDARRERVLAELVALANRVLVADGADTGDPAAHHAALETALGYVDVGLALRGAQEPEAIARVLEATPALDLFREGHARAAELHRQARRFADTGWAARHPRALGLLDPPLDGRVQGLLERRPLYFAVDASLVSGVLRPFRSAGEIEEARVALELAELLGRVLLDGLALEVARLVRPDVLDDEGQRTPVFGPRFSTVLLTALAWHHTRGKLSAEPLPVDVAADFVRRVASRRTAGPDAAESALVALVRQLADNLGLTPRETAALSRFGHAALEHLAAECGMHDPGVPLDPRGTSTLLVQGGHA